MSKGLDQIGWILIDFCAKNGLQLRTEYIFHPERKWRFDWAIPGKMVAIEYEGIISAKSRHLTLTGFSADLEKYNQAQLLGYKVLRYTTLNYSQITEDLKKLL